VTRAGPQVDRLPGTAGYWLQALGRFRHDRLGVVCATYLLGVVVLALLAQPIADHLIGYDPADQDLTHTFALPSGQHLLGTDYLGRDTLSRVLFGARISLGVALATVALLLVLGTTVGLVSGFFGGWIDELLMRFVEMLLAIPSLYVIIMLATLIPPSPLTLVLVIASINWMTLARLVRAEVLATKNLEFMFAARSIGASPLRLMRAHLLPALIPTITATATLAVGWVILVQATLDFLGFGVQPPTPSWGNMITVAQRFFNQGFLLALPPGLMIFMTVLALNLLGNAIRDALDLSREPADRAASY
jgi:peptide/nickel transport system permease protein